MANISRDTFDKLKHYVSVRLQQGVPFLDADFNEAQDIRKYEIEAFVKWFVGSGIPKGNDGFRIMPIKNRVILRWAGENWDGQSPEQSALRVIREEDSRFAANVLGFDSSNCYAKRIAPPAAQLVGKKGKTQFNFGSPPKALRIQVDDTAPVDVMLGGQLTADAVALAIGDTVPNLSASVGGDSDFDIKGWSSQNEGAGICLVDGWDVRNETSINYKNQVGVVDPFDAPGEDTTYIVYLDAWETEINSADDPSHLINSHIGIETCTRLKREWRVRIKEYSEWPPHDDLPPNAEEGHVYYRLASIFLPAGVASVEDENITDLRQTELTLSDLSVRFAAHDHSGGPLGVILDTDSLSDKAITTRKLADDAVSVSKIRTGAVTEDKIADEAVNYYKMRFDVVAEGQIAGMTSGQTEMIPVAQLWIFEERPYWLVIRPVPTDGHALAAITGEILYVSDPPNVVPEEQSFSLWVRVSRAADNGDLPVDVFWQVKTFSKN